MYSDVPVGSLSPKSQMKHRRVQSLQNQVIEKMNTFMKGLDEQTQYVLL